MIKQSQDSEGIEGISSPENLEDEVLLGYFIVDSDGKKRPIPTPKRLVPTSTANGENSQVGQANTTQDGERAVVIVQGNGKVQPTLKLLNPRC